MPRTKKVEEPVEKSEVDLLKEQIELLIKQNKLLQEKTISNNENKQLPDDKEESEMRPDTYIKVMSLCPHLLILNASPEGKGGKVFRFTHFGEVKKILKSFVDFIVENNRRFLDDGYFCFLSRNAVKSYGLDDVYEQILTKDKIEKILHGNESDAVNLFKSTTDRQRENIVRLILDKMLSGEKFDDNLLYRLSEVMGPGYSIREKYAKLLETKKNL